MQWNVYFYYIFIVGVALIVFSKGDNELKYTIIACIVASLASSISAMNHKWDFLSFYLFTIDSLLLIFFWYISIVTRSYWPYWVTGWQLISVLGHIQRYLFPEILPEPYSMLTRLMSYMIIILIFVSCFFYKSAKNIDSSGAENENNNRFKRTI
jgi:hypothetical protein